VDGVLMSPGILARAHTALGRRGRPLAIVRLNWNSVYCFGWGPDRAAGAEVMAAEQALRQGADAALVSLTVNTGSADLDAANVELAAKLIHGCLSAGLPVIGEYFPALSDQRDDADLHDEVRRGARMIAELGANAVKTFLSPTWMDVAQGTPAPLLALGARSDGDDEGSLRLAEKQLAAGAHGLVYGRRAFQAQDPVAFMHDLAAVVRDSASR
jgi:DhnA family fructose-bisphosphate aldolase class Ia